MMKTLIRRLMALALFSALGQTVLAATGVTVLPAAQDAGPITVFYPSAAAPARITRGHFTFDLAADAAPLRGNGHLIVISHGSGGSPWTQVDLVITLVKAGFTVAMPEHAGDNSHDTSAVGPVSWRRRPQEVSHTIDALAVDARFAPLLDFKHVGIYGMSAGGLTALTLAGARWSPALLNAHCQAHLRQDYPACVGLASSLTGSMLDGLRLAIARRLLNIILGRQKTLESWSDPRITAAVAAVPMAAAIDPVSLATPRIPLGLVRAGHDAWLAPQWHIDAVRAACARNCTLIAEMPRAGHGSILSPRPPPERLSPAAARLLNDPPGFDRASLPAVYDAIARFFIQNLRR
ncbi:MAG: dienelactone hydrolase [Burkholderiaceae bacterium]|jgi:predicted dienelactone hydrolase|nr:dienelactone hydrolase [Burkholderiaceae bacterium]